MDLCSVRVQGIEAVCTEQGSGRPLLLLHGWGASHTFWRNLWPDIVPRFHCLAPDLPGWGDSEKPDAPYTVEWYADWAASLLDVKKTGPAAVVGHSMGATIALLLALRHPEKVSSLGLVCPLIRGADGLNWETRLLSSPVIRTMAFPFTRSKRILRFITRNFQYGMRLDEADLLLIAQGTYASLTRPLESLKRVDLSGRLGEVRCPTLVIGCDKDLVIHPEQARLAAQIPGAAYTCLADCGHLAMLEQPHAFNPLLTEFLSRHQPTMARLRPPKW